MPKVGPYFRVLAVQDAILLQRMKLQRKREDINNQEAALSNLDFGFVEDAFFHGTINQFGNKATRSQGHDTYLQKQ